MNSYQQALEDFRNHYKKIYDVNLDDEILYFFIRINEMQLSLNNEFAGLKNTLHQETTVLQQSVHSEIAAIPKIQLKTAKEVFMYGLGKSLYPTIICLCLALTLLAYVLTAPKPPAVIVKKGVPGLRIEENGREYFLKINEH
jgi:hypothetical protein